MPRKTRQPSNEEIPASSATLSPDNSSRTLPPVVPVTSRPPRRPTFEGLDFECPEQFLQKFDRYASRLGITEDEDKAGELLDCLSGKAAAFTKTLPASHMPYEALAAALQEEYGGSRVLRRLHINLHRQVKKSNESVATFTHTRLLLLNRLFPDEDVATTVERLLQLLPEHIAANVALKEPATIAEFQRCLTLVESAVTTPTPRPRTSALTSGTEASASRARETTARDPPPCHYCPGNHWHRDCPVIKERYPRPGNDTGAGH